jgi:hypothetical protein
MDSHLLDAFSYTSTSFLILLMMVGCTDARGFRFAEASKEFIDWPRLLVDFESNICSADCYIIENTLKILMESDTTPNSPTKQPISICDKEISEIMEAIRSRNKNKRIVDRLGSIAEVLLAPQIDLELLKHMCNNGLP